jgi:predicted enzyme related to lactoylglutathione lyase
VEFDRYEDGVPSWVDLSSADLAKSREFYGALFGWNCPEGPPEAGAIRSATWAGRPLPASVR